MSNERNSAVSDGISRPRQESLNVFLGGVVSPYRGYFALRPQYAAPPSAPSPRPLPSRGGGGKVGPFRNSNPHAEANTGVSHGQNLRFFPL